MSGFFTDLAQGLDDRAGSGNLFKPLAPFVPRVPSPSIHGQEIAKQFDETEALNAAAASAIIYRLTYYPAMKAASVPWVVWEMSENSPKGVPVFEHPFVEPIEHPRADDKVGRTDLIATLHAHYDLAGNGLLGEHAGTSFATGRRVVSELENVDPRWVFPVPDDFEFIRSYNWRDTHEVAWDPADIIHWRRTNPALQYWGLSCLQAAALSAEIIEEGQILQLRRYTRDGTPGLVISDESIGTREKRIQAENEFNARMRETAGGITILGAAEGSKQTLVASGLPIQDLQLIDALAQDMDLVVLAYGFLPAIFGRAAATLNNYAVGVLHEWRVVMEKNAGLADLFTRRYVPREERSRFRIAPFYGDVPALQEVEIEKLKLIKELAFKGASLNDLIREIGLGLPIRAEGDEVLLPANVRRQADVLKEVL